MRKKLYDFSILTGIIIVLAYGFMFLFLFFSIINSDKRNWVAISAIILLVVSFGFIIWYYVLLAVTVTEKGITQGRKIIDKKDIKWKVEYNSRFRYNEIIFYSKYDNIDKMNKKDKKKKTIIVQYFPKHEIYITKFFEEEEVNEKK